METLADQEPKLPEVLWEDSNVAILDRLDQIVTLLRELVRELRMERNNQ